MHSPNWPSSYPDNTECEWEIEVLPGYHIEYTFNATFAFPEDCSDYVMVSYMVRRFSLDVLSYNSVLNYIYTLLFGILRLIFELSSL